MDSGDGGPNGFSGGEYGSNDGSNGGDGLMMVVVTINHLNYYTLLPLIRAHEKLHLSPLIF